MQSSENPLVPCPAIYLDPASTIGPLGGNDECGDHNDYTQAELPDFCDVLITVAPVKCEGAN